MPRVRVTHVLARLDAIDTPPGRHANRPANSLREIHLLWVPQTYATLDQRLRALDLIRRRESNAAWKLMLGILPQGHDMSMPSPMPRWRDFTVDKVEVVTRGLIGRGAAAITERLLADVGVNSTRWSQLLDRFADLAPDPEAGLAALEAAEQRIIDKADRAVLWASLRRVLHQHRQYPDAEWSMPAEVLDRLEAVYDRASHLPASLSARLGSSGKSVPLPKPSAEGWEVAERGRGHCPAAGGASHVLGRWRGGRPVARAPRRHTAAYIGKALYDSGRAFQESDLFDALLEAALRSDDARERDVAHGLIISVFRDRKEPWAATLIAKAKDEAWGDTALR